LKDSEGQEMRELVTGVSKQGNLGFLIKRDLSDQKSNSDDQIGLIRLRVVLGRIYN